MVPLSRKLTAEHAGAAVEVWVILISVGVLGALAYRGVAGAGR